MESAIRPDQIPLLHRGMIPLGLGLMVLWIALEASIPVANPLVHPFAEDARFLSGALLLFGIVFSVFGLGCELIVAVIEGQKSSDDEWDRLADLAGCTESSRRRAKVYKSSRRPTKVYKRVCVTPEELQQIKSLLEGLRSR